MLARAHVHDRPDGRVELGIHEHDRLPVREGVERDLGPELDRARQFDEHVDLLGARQQVGVVRDGGATAGDGLLELARGRDDRDVAEARVAGELDGLVGLTAVDRGDAHPGHAVGDLVGEALAP